jgi:hypothetical protein
LKESISIKVSNKKERFLHKTTRAERKTKIEDKKAQKQCKNFEKDKTKQKKDNTGNSAARKGVGLVSNVRPAQSASGLPEVLSLDQAIDRAGPSNELNQFPSHEETSVLNSVLTDLPNEARKQCQNPGKEKMTEEKYINQKLSACRDEFQ